MARVTKNKKLTLDKYDFEKFYSLDDASKIVKDISFTKFDASVDLDIRLGVDPKKADQMVRGNVSLPHGTGKNIKVLALCSPDKEDEAKKAGADHVGFDDYIKKIAEGWSDIDVIITMPSLMAKLGKLGKFLGPRGLMPNPKSGTVTENIEKAIKDLKHGQVIFKAEQQGIIQGTIANSAMDEAQITENLNSFIAELKRIKPASSKGIYLQDIYLSTSMGPGYRIDISQF